MGAQKLLMAVRGVPMIDRVLDACRDYDTIVIASPEVAPHVHERPRMQTIQNTKPDLGMAHSFEIANGAAPPENAVLVFLGDKPLVTAALANAVVQHARSPPEPTSVFPSAKASAATPCFSLRTPAAASRCKPVSRCRRCATIRRSSGSPFRWTTRAPIAT